MALPPERITVKRRRDEEPVDALYIEPKRNRASALWKRADADGEARYAGPLIPPVPPQDFQLPSSTNAGPKGLPIEHSTGGTDKTLQLQQNIQSKIQEPAYIGVQRPASPITRPFRHNEKGQDLSKPTAKLRSFYLKTNSLPRPYAVSKPNAHKQRSRRGDLAIFIEQTGKVLQSQHADAKPVAIFDDTGRKNIDSHQNNPKSEPSRKRPGATAEERKWRATNWGKSVESKTHATTPTQLARSIGPTKNWDTESPELAEELQKIAVHEINAAEQRANRSTAHQQLKTQPKPPKPRQSKIQDAVDPSIEDVAMADSNEHEDDNTYVFDTYVRSTVQSTGVVEPTGPYVDPLQGMYQGSIGILVIDEDEEQLWETYGEIEESDPDWNSEEEDENAEDFHGNDYPEDEVNSDDEFGRGTYSYRHGASDDEEFWEENASWSD